MEDRFLLHLHANSPLRSHNGALQIVVSSERRVSSFGRRPLTTPRSLSSVSSLQGREEEKEEEEGRVGAGAPAAAEADERKKDVLSTAARVQPLIRQDVPAPADHSCLRVRGQRSQADFPSSPLSFILLLRHLSEALKTNAGPDPLGEKWILEPFQRRDGAAR